MMIRKLSTLFFLIALLILPRPTSAELRAEELQLTCALASMAAYSSDTAMMFREMLKTRGWSLETIEAYSDAADAKAILLRRNDVNILSICGTEDRKDAAIDVRFKLVEFTGGGMVHQGFNEYTEVLLNNERFKELINALLYSDEKLYITGHSLGGAVAILTAARLVDLGEQLEVLTFGAPAVGDQSFAERFDGRLKLTRITASGDPIKKALKKLGYVHVGNELKYTPAKSVEHFRHKMAVYLDCALRNYYDANSEIEIASGGENRKIYVVPLRMMNIDKEDKRYVELIIRDVLRSRRADLVLSAEPPSELDYKTYDDDFAELDAKYFAEARAANCDLILIELLQSRRVREARKDIDQITIEKIVCNLNGFPLSMETSSMNTNEVTAIEAVLLAQLKSAI